MTADSDLAADSRAGYRRQRLSLVPRATGVTDPAPPVRLLREWKGVLRPDLARSSGRLPGRVAAAIGPAVLPVRRGALLAGPLARRRARRRRPALVVGAVLLAALLGCWWS